MIPSRLTVHWTCHGRTRKRLPCSPPSLGGLSSVGRDEPPRELPDRGRSVAKIESLRSPLLHVYVPNMWTKSPHRARARQSGIGSSLRTAVALAVGGRTW